MKLIFYTVALATAMGPNGFGQTSDTAKLEFEVASIKAAAPAGFFHSPDTGTGGPGSADPGMFRCASCTLGSLILKAFELQQYQFPGQQSLPGNAFAISAKVPNGTTPQHFLVMLQNLLKDRFGLAYHFDKKEMHGYRLVVAKNGPKLTEAKEPYATVPPVEAGDSYRQGSGQHTPGGWGAGSGTGPIRPGLTFTFGGTQYRGDHQTTDELAQMIANQIGKPVVDETGLTGKYDIRLKWAGETAHSHPQGAAGGYAGGMGHDHGGPGGGSAGNSATTPDNPSGPTILEALQSQLGLRLVVGPKSVARLFVVDHVESNPTANSRIVPNPVGRIRLISATVPDQKGGHASFRDTL